MVKAEEQERVDVCKTLDIPSLLPYFTGKSEDSPQIQEVGK